MSENVRVLISEPLSPRAEEILARAEGFEVINKPGLPREELLELVTECDALLVRSATKVDEEVLGAGGRLKVVARAGIGVDNVDLATASLKGILVINAPDGNIITTAEHTIAMMFSLARKIPSAVHSVRGGLWERSKFVGSELYSKVLGVVGLGRVGSTVARLATGLEMNVIAYDPFISGEAAEKRGVKPVSLDELLEQSDYVTLHVPKTPETAGLIGAAEIAKMRRGARIINCARGGLLDEAAAAEALDSGQLAGVALDVYEVEPPGEESLLVGRDNVVCTPHLGASTEEAQENVAISVAEGVVAYLATGTVKNAVNLPSLSTEDLERVSPYMDLTERLGRFLGQLAEGGPKSLEVTYCGPLDSPMELLSASALKGLLSEFISGAHINLVNGPVLAKERGIEIIATTRSEMPVYTNLIELKLITDAGERSVAGAFVHEGEPRIVRIDQFSVDTVPEGYMLVFTNDDQPGMIGAIGTLLGEHKINIAGMQLGRTRKNDKAVAILAVDNLIPDEVMEKVRALPSINTANLVCL
ncbi:MAG: phosphoglycerate dehydrogenase [Nitrospinaceae bacterium]|nr:phosphoglycerate dehydrogenase [Nitrospinaceae bacterium]